MVTLLYVLPDLASLAAHRPLCQPNGMVNRQILPCVATQQQYSPFDEPKARCVESTVVFGSF